MRKFSAQEIQKLLNLLKNVGDEIMEIYDKFDNKKDVEYKSDNTPVTAADTKASDLISDFLTKNYPNFTILCEEKNKENLPESDYFWVIDPIDGTKEFINKTGEFTINIGLCCENKAVAGFVYAPNLREMYYAVKNCGSFYLKSQDEFLLEKFARVHVSNRRERLVVLDSRNYKNSRNVALYEKNKAKIAQILAIGSSIKGCLIARGAADVYYRYGLTSKWDICAIQIICEEAGAVFKQLDGSEIVYKLNDVHYLNEGGFYIVNNAENILTI